VQFACNKLASMLIVCVMNTHGTYAGDPVRCCGEFINMVEHVPPPHGSMAPVCVVIRL
jgi:hypothetical protein